jgi:hypothetical protein
MYSGSPGLALLGATIAGGGLASRAAANKMALGKVNKMLDQARGTPAREMFRPQIAAQVAQQYNFPDIDPDSGEPLVDVDFSEGYAVPIYGRLPKEKQFVNLNSMRR